MADVWWAIKIRDPLSNKSWQWAGDSESIATKARHRATWGTKWKAAWHARYRRRHGFECRLVKVTRRAVPSNTEGGTR